MNDSERLRTKAAILLDQLLIKPKTNSSLSETILGWLVVSSITGTPVYYAFQSLTREPNVWFFVSVVPATFFILDRLDDSAREESRSNTDH